VTWVVRISAFDILVISAFCRPMMKHSSSTVRGMKRPDDRLIAAPNNPKTSNSPASTTRGRAKALRNCRRRLQLTIHAVVTAPADESQQGHQPRQCQPEFAQGEMVRDRRQHARHV
jgi:hypothetical protein